MFEILHSPLGKIDGYTLRDTSNGFHVHILNGWGAALNAMWVDRDGTQLHFAEGYKDEQELLDTHQDRSCGAVLFPFPNRLNQGRYQYKGRVYELPINFKYQRHAIHGLVQTSHFELGLSSSNDNCAQILLCHQYSGQQAGFPWHFEISVSWKLQAFRVLSCQTIIKNTSRDSFPMGIGWHPYFKLPNTTIDDCILEFPAQQAVITDNNSIPTGEYLDEKKWRIPTPIQDSFLDTCWSVPQQENNKIVLDHKRDSWFLEINMQGGSNKYKYLQAYTPANRQSIALEPMSCTANVFNHKTDLMELKPGNEADFLWSVQVNEK
jgi:aldose 1-epimerase